MKMTIDVTKYRSRRKKENMKKAFRYQLQKWTGKTIKQIIRNISGPILNTKTGKLRRSISGVVSYIGRLTKTTIGSGIFGRKAVKYAAIHEFGGKIRPRRAKMLTIPFPGVKGRAANYPGAFIIKSKKGNLLLVGKKGKGLKLLFALKTEVDIPARHWLSRSIDEMKPDLFRSLKPVEILKVMKKGLG